MAESEVLILGSGLAGSIAALTLARKGVNVTLVSAGPLEETSYSYQSNEGILYFPPEESDTYQLKGTDRCLLAIEQLKKMGPECLEEILIKDLMIDFDRDEEGEYLPYGDSLAVLKSQEATGKTILEAIHAQLEESTLVQVLPNHTAFELITLEHHSTKYADIYKKPTCLGAYLYNQETDEVLQVIAKETIIATGGIGGVYRDTTSPQFASGSGIAMAHRAGARVINLSLMEFTPNEETLSADNTAGGIAVDKNGQTSVQRLHAIGRAACTGAHGKTYNPAIIMLESIVWAYACANDIARRVQKFAYYSPSTKSYETFNIAPDNTIIEQDLQTVRNMMSDYACVNTDKHRIKRIQSILQEINDSVNETYRGAKLSNDLIQLQHTLYTANLVTNDLCRR